MYTWANVCPTKTAMSAAGDHVRPEGNARFATGSAERHQGHASYPADQKGQEGPDGQRAPPEVAQIETQDAGQLDVAESHPAGLGHHQHVIEAYSAAIPIAACNKRTGWWLMRAAAPASGPDNVGRQGQCVGQSVHVEIDHRKRDADGGQDTAMPERARGHAGSEREIDERACDHELDERVSHADTAAAGATLASQQHPTQYRARCRGPDLGVALTGNETAAARRTRCGAPAR